MLKRAIQANYRTVPATAQLSLTHAVNADFSAARASLTKEVMLKAPALGHFVSAVIEYSAGNYQESAHQLAESEKTEEMHGRA